MRNLAGGNSLESAAQLAVQELYPSRQGSEAALKFAKAKLKQSDIHAAMEHLYDDAELPIVEMVRLQVAHVKGTLTKDVVTKDGDVVQVKIPPSYAALKDAMAATIPVAPKTVHVRQENFNHSVAPVNMSEPIDVTPRGFED